MFLPQPSSPVAADLTEMLAKTPAPTQQSHELANLGRGQPLVWEELPKSTAVKCLADSNVQWMELPRISPGTGWTSSEAERTDMSWSESPDSVAQFIVPHWPSKPAWAKQLIAKQILQIPAREDGYTSKDMVGLVQACPRQATCPGFPSVFEDREKKWIFGEEPLLRGSSSNNMDENLPGPVFLASTYPEMPALWGLGSSSSSTGVVNLKASCPAVSQVAGLTSCHGSRGWTGDRLSTWGFPSFPEPRRQPPLASVLHLLPLCPTVSAIPGFPSAEGRGQVGWVTEAGSLIFSKPKKIECRVSSSPSGCEHPSSAWALAPSCPQWSRTPGFPSVPRYSMLTLLSVWPKASTVPGCGSEGYRGPSKRLWHCQPRTLFDRPTKVAPFMAYEPGWGGASVKNMFRLTLCCPEACRTPGFPSYPQCVSKVGFAAVCVVHCCSGASKMEGLGPAVPGTRWVKLAKQILMSPREKEAEALAPFAGQWGHQERGYSMKNMVTSCPTESQVHGFPSAPPVDRPPNMVSLYASASCSPCILGIPSSQTPTECVPKQPRGKAFPQRPQKDTKTFKTEQMASALQREVDMAAMVPSCPHNAASPGFPSASHLNPSDDQAAGETLSWWTCTHLHLRYLISLCVFSPF